MRHVHLLGLGLMLIWASPSTVLADPCPCVGTVATFPYGEDFEAGLGLWENTGDDDFDWDRYQGETPSSNTGPDVDHTLGTEEGYYVYTEATDNNPEMTAILAGPCFDLTGLAAPQLSFYYHMVGDTMGTLRLEITDDTCATWEIAFEMSGFQGGEWHLAVVDLAPYAGQTIRARFRGVTGESYESDMAIDDIYVGEAVDYPGGCCNLDDGACLGYMTATDCAAEGNTRWYLVSDCSEDNFCPQPPPANDLCVNAVPIVALPFTDPNADYKWATPDLPVSCDNDECTDLAYGVWYQYTPAADCGARIRAVPNEGGAYPVFSVFTGADCDNLTEVHCYSGQETTVDLAAGTTYWILVGHPWCEYQPGSSLTVTFNCSKGACCLGDVCSLETANACAAGEGYYFGDESACVPDVCLTGACCTVAGCEALSSGDCAGVEGEFHGNGYPCELGTCPPLNETCLTAEPVTDGAPAVEGNNRRASEIDDTAASCDDNSTMDLWYEYTATCTGTAVIDNEGSYIWDTVLSAWDACGGSEIGCATYGPTGDRAQLELPVIAGTHYWIRFASFFYITGDYTINIVCQEAPQGACCTGDACAIDYQLTCAAGGGIYGGDGSLCGGPDCNANMIDDICDVLGGASPDCNANSVPDECDLSAGSSLDRDANGLPDECDPDCNANGIVDGCDLMCRGGCSEVPGCGASADCQADGVPDECQLVSSACDTALVDNGSSDLVNGLRPDSGWSYVGVADDFTLTEAIAGTCLRFDMADFVNSGNLTTMRVRIYENPNGLMNLGSFWAATPLFDQTYAVNDHTLTITDTGLDLYYLDVLRFEASGPAYALPAGHYAVHLMFPGTWDAGFWTTAGADDSDCAVTWGEWVDYPSDACSGGDDMTRLSFALVGKASHDCNATLVPDECESIAEGDFNADGVVDVRDHVWLADCLDGPTQTPTRVATGCQGLCRAAFDADSDGDIDLYDFAVFTTRIAP